MKESAIVFLDDVKYNKCSFSEYQDTQDSYGMNKEEFVK